MEPVIKILGSLTGVGAGILSTKIVDAIWEKTTGETSPNKAQKDKKSNQADTQNESFAKAIAFAVITAVVTTAIQQATKKGTNKWIAKYNKSEADVA